MNRALSILLLLIGVLSFSPTKAQAITVFCTNCSTMPGEMLQLAEDIITSAQSAMIQINTYQAYLKLIMEPIQNALIVNALLTQQSNTINLITGGLSGQPLLQSDPEKWIKTQGLNVVKLSVNDVLNQNGVYGASILSTIVDNYRSGKGLSLQVKLDALGKSSIPGTIQASFCKDATLTREAMRDVRASDGTYDPAALAARKQELFNALCRGNPLTDAALGRKLEEIRTQRPDIAGWDSWLKVINGDNEYARSVEARLAIAKEEEEEEEEARDDVNRGGGIVSATECKDDPEDVPTIANFPCRFTQITNSSGALSDIYNQALGAPLDKLIASTGNDGMGIFGTISSLLSAKNTIEAYKNAFSFASDDDGGDLEDNSDGKDSITQPITDLLDRHERALNDLETADNSLLVEIAATESLADEVRGCYARLVEENITSEGSTAVQAGYRYASTKSQQAANLHAKIAQDESGIAEARTVIAEFRARISASNSSDEIAAMTQQFLDTVESQNLPNEQDTIERKNELARLRGDNMIDRAQDGAAYSLKQQCSNIRIQWQQQNGGGA